jgi:catechol 2,3-dioxygenase-like lactoylglutathione lyase family enzyme
VEPRISIITIATDDLDRAVRFYEAMGLTRHAGITDGVAFFQMGGAIFGLFPRASAEEDSGIAFARAPSAVYLAYNTRSDAEVDEVLAMAEKAGGRILKPAGRALLGRLVRLFRRCRRACLGSGAQSGLSDRGRRHDFAARLMADA